MQLWYVEMNIMVAHASTKRNKYFPLIGASMTVYRNTIMSTFFAAFFGNGSVHEMVPNQPRCSYVRAYYLLYVIPIRNLATLRCLIAGGWNKWRVGTASRI